MSHFIRIVAMVPCTADLSEQAALLSGIGSALNPFRDIVKGFDGTVTVDATRTKPRLTAAALVQSGPSHEQAAAPEMPAVADGSLQTMPKGWTEVDTSVADELAPNPAFDGFPGGSMGAVRRRTPADFAADTAALSAAGVPSGALLNGDNIAAAIAAATKAPAPWKKSRVA